MAIEVKIGISDTSRELTVNSPLSSEEAQKTIEGALSGKESVLSLVDDKGARFIVPITKVAYIEVGSSENRKVGFGS